jgi:hypothetical protein
MPIPGVHAAMITYERPSAISHAGVVATASDVTHLEVDLGAVAIK